MSFTESHETVDGCKTRIMRGGSGAPLVFLHGANGAPAWLPFMAKLAESFDVIVPEHPGYGGTDDPDWLDGIGDIAYFYLDLFDHLGLKAVNLVGQSTGGWIAAELAVRNQTGLSTVTLAAPAGVYARGVKRPDIFMLSPEETARHLVHDQSIAQKMIAAPMSDDQIRISLQNRLTTAKLGWQPRMHNPDLRKWLHRITVPVQLLWGEEDAMQPIAYAREWQSLLRGAKLTTIAGAGHLTHVEKPDDHVRAITGFIAEAGR
jgi:pimeloyl-ACP methyl ester carboxylesterase